MPASSSPIDAIVSQKMLPLFYHHSREVSLKTVEALYLAGVHIIEFTNRGREAADVFEFIKGRASRDFPGLLLGIGTIKDAAAASRFISLGADFIICPTVDAGVAGVCRQAGLVWIPGCMTPTEISTAEYLGATLVKLFPGSLQGPGFVSAVRDIFPNLLFMPTGGVEPEETNLKEWFRAGVAAVGMGSKLVSKSLLETEDYRQMEKLTRDIFLMLEAV